MENTQLLALKSVVDKIKVNKWNRCSCGKEDKRFGRSENSSNVMYALHTEVSFYFVASADIRRKEIVSIMWKLFVTQDANKNEQQWPHMAISLDCKLK